MAKRKKLQRECADGNTAIIYLFSQLETQAQWKTKFGIKLFENLYITLDDNAPYG